MINKLKKLYSKKDPSHNWNHIIRIKKNAEKISKSYKSLDKKLLKFLIEFHGLKEYVEQNKKEFDKIFVKCLLRHNKNPKKIEEKIVHDANLMDNLGKHGIKKALGYGKIIKRDKKDTYEYLRRNTRNINFYTNEGKRIGKEQIKIMQRILK